MEIITRAEAKAQGLAHYYTGKPCKHGHTATRRTITGYCNECCGIKYAKNRADEDYLAKERIRNRNWKRANKDIINARRRVRDKEGYVPPGADHPRKLAIAEGDKTYFTGMPCKNGHVSHRYTDSGYCIQCQKDRMQTEEFKQASNQRARKWRKLNPEKEKEKSRRWAAKNKWAGVAKSSRRRCAQRNATPAWADREKINTKYKERETMSRLTGIQHHVDHIIPIQSDVVCGLNVESNLRIIPSRDNQRKSNKWEGTYE